MLLEWYVKSKSFLQPRLSGKVGGGEPPLDFWKRVDSSGKNQTGLDSLGTKGLS